MPYILKAERAIKHPIPKVSFSIVVTLEDYNGIMEEKPHPKTRNSFMNMLLLKGLEQLKKEAANE